VDRDGIISSLIARHWQASGDGDQEAEHVSTPHPPFWTTRNPESASEGAKPSKPSVEATRLREVLRCAESPGTEPNG
jgi:hypothetical protein